MKSQKSNVKSQIRLNLFSVISVPSVAKNVQTQNSKLKTQIANIKYSLIIILLCLIKINGAEWKTYTNTNFINGICGDSLYLYCATQGGLTIFSQVDSSFTNVYTNAEGLPANRVNCLTRDKWGQLWLGTFRGISVFNPTTKIIQNYRSLGTGVQNITCLQFSNDTILVGTQNGLFVIDTKGTSYFDDDIIIHPNLPTSKIFSLAVSDEFWVGIFPGVIKLNRDLQTWTMYSHPFGDSVKGMAIAHDTLYIATEQGMAKYDGSGFMPVVHFPQNYSVFSLKYDNNNFYIATTAGLFQYDGQSLSLMLNQDTRAIFIKDGLYVGLGGLISLGGGLKHYHDGVWKSYSSKGLASNIVSCVISSDEGIIYAMYFTLAHWGTRTIGYKKRSEDWQILYDTLMNSNIGAIDSKGRIWLGHWFLDGGLSSYDPNLNIWSVRRWVAQRGVIAALGIDVHNTKWVYNGNATVIAIDSLNQEIEFLIPGLTEPAERHGRGYEFVFDKQNRTWLASPDGLVMIDYNNTLFDQSDDNYRIYRQGLPAQDINSAAIDAQNKIWCATAQGAAKFDGNVFSMYNTNNSPILADKVIRIKTDAWGNVWFLTEAGISQYNIYTKEWVSYTKDNSGLIPNVENDAKFYEWLSINEKQGFLLVGTKEGISQFFYKTPAPDSLSQIVIYPNPFIFSQHQVITFDSLPIGSIIRIYTIDGKFMTELNSEYNYAGIRWQPTNLTSGIYLAVVKSGTKQRIAKFAVIR